MKICAICGSSVDDSAETCPHDGLADWLNAPASVAELQTAVVTNNDEVAVLLARAAKERADKVAAKAAKKAAAEAAKTALAN